MKETKANTESPNKGTTTPNKQTPRPTMTLADCYKQAWATELNKLSKINQEILLRRIKAPPDIVRGQPVTDPQVNKFVKAVIELGEHFYSIQEKKAANTASKTAP